MKNIDNKKQADILVKYLINHQINSQRIYDLYSVSVGDITNDSEEKLLRFAFSHPTALGFLDSALVFLRPVSELRRRIYIMFSILEASPEYSDLFLPHKVGFIEFIGIFGTGIRAIFRSIVGIVIIKVKRL